jgi:hypothetical protein
MKTHFEISSGETGTVVILLRNIAKAFGRRLRENELPCNNRFYAGSF